MECTCTLLRITLTGPLRSHFYLGRNASTNINAPRSEANVYIQIQMTENEHPKPDKRANCLGNRACIRTATTRREKELALLACVHYRTAGKVATSRPKGRYQNYRKMVDIC